MHGITELCISVSLNAQIVQGSLQQLFRATKLKKLCLVINISDIGKTLVSEIEGIFASILMRLSHLKLFQIVFSMETTDNDKNKHFCVERMKIINQISRKMVDVIINLRTGYFTASCNKKPLLFRFHVKSCHKKKISACVMKYNDVLSSHQTKQFAQTINQFIINYLVTYPLGKIQFKWTYNAENHSMVNEQLTRCMNGLNGLFRVSTKKAGSFEKYVEMDAYKMYAISALKMDLHQKDTDVHHDNK